MSGDTPMRSTRDSTILFLLSELEPHTVEALVELLTQLTQLIESQCHESVRRIYEEDARNAARDQLPLDFFDDSDIEPPPF